MTPLAQPRRLLRRHCDGRGGVRPGVPGPRRPQAGGFSNRIAAWDYMGYHGITWASINHRGVTPPRALDLNTSLTVRRLKEWLRGRQGSIGRRAGRVSPADATKPRRPACEPLPQDGIGRRPRRRLRSRIAAPKLVRGVTASTHERSIDGQTLAHVLQRARSASCHWCVARDSRLEQVANTARNSAADSRNNGRRSRVI
jgi:hypothetical protein